MCTLVYIGERVTVRVNSFRVFVSKYVFVFFSIRMRDFLGLREKNKTHICILFSIPVLIVYCIHGVLILLTESH